MTKRDSRVTKINSDYVNRYDLVEKRNRLRRKRLVQRMAFVFMAILVLFGALTTYHIKQRIVYSEKQAEHDTLLDEMTALENVQTGLLEEIDLLNDEEYILDIARTNYFLSKKGELIFQVVEEEQRQY